MTSSCPGVIGGQSFTASTARFQVSAWMFTMIGPAGWAAELAAVLGRRDRVIRTAHAAGVSKSEIHRITGLARSTVDRIMTSEAS